MSSRTLLTAAAGTFASEPCALIFAPMRPVIAANAGKFQKIAAIGRAKTMAKPATESTCRNQLHRQQRDDAEGDRTARHHGAEEVEEGGPDEREIRRQGVRVEDGRHRVGGVMKAVTNSKLTAQSGRRQRAAGRAPTAWPARRRR